MGSPAPMDWAARYRDRNTPWDLGVAHPEFEHRLGSLAPGTRLFVPGCGRGHDALYFARQGCEVIAVDVVPDLADVVRAELEEHGGRFEVTDALAYRTDEPFDALLEHTFFCAIDPSERARWGELADSVLGPNGRVCALAFPMDRPAELGGPPWGYRPADMESALAGRFRLTIDEPVQRRISSRQWEERWTVFERVKRPR